MKRFFEKVKKWNYKAGVPVKDSFGLPDIADRELATDLIIEEATELLEAENKEEVLDALADLKFVLYGAAARYGVSAEEFSDYFHKVCKSNDSKFAETEEEAILSIDHEARRLNISPNLIDYTEVDGSFILFRTDTKKILKSYKYKSPEKFGSLDEES